MRSLTSGINSQLTVSGALFGWLLELTLTNGQVFRYTSIDTGFTWNGFTWQPLDMSVPEIEWDGGAVRSGRIVIGDANLVLWAFALNLMLARAGIRLYAIYHAAPNEAEPVYSGRVGPVTRGNDLTVVMGFSNESETVSAPRNRVQYVINPKFLLAAGTVLHVGGQRWILERPKSGL